MLIAHNPTSAGIQKAIAASKHNAAKWIRDTVSGEYWYWPAEYANHSDMAEQLGIIEYTKGICIPKE